MDPEKLKEDLKTEGFRLGALYGFDYERDLKDLNSFVAKKTLREGNGWRNPGVELKIIVDVTFDARFQKDVIVQLRHGDNFREVKLSVTADGKDVEDWRPAVKKIVQDYLNELGKVYARLAEFNMTGA